MLLYLFGKKYGRDFFIRKNYKFISAEDIFKVEKQYQKHGALILVSSRFVVGMRVILVIVAGIGNYSFIKMVLFSVISYFLFAGLLLYTSNKLVENLDAVEDYFMAYNLILWPLLIIAVILFIIWKIRRIKNSK